METKLDVLIATYGSDGPARVAKMNLPKVDGVRYIVSWQNPDCSDSSLPENLTREDIVFRPTPTVGLSNNRNHSIACASAPFCLIADDDLRYTAEQLSAVVSTLENNPDVDVALFRYSGDDNKTYPGVETDIGKRWPKNYYCTSFEIAFRRQSISGKISFNTRFGINARPFSAGEESIFLIDCQRAGLRCRFFPVTITHHAGKTTGNRATTDTGVPMAEGAFIRTFYGWKGFPRVPLLAWRRYRSRQMPFFFCLLNASKGFFINPKKYLNEI